MLIGSVIVVCVMKVVVLCSLQLGYCGVYIDKACKAWDLSRKRLCCYGDCVCYTWRGCI